MPETTNDVLSERLDNLSKTNTTEHASIQKFFTDTITELKIANEKEYTRIEKVENRIAILETWKAVFVAKMTIYVGIAVFLGTLISNFIIQIISKKMF